MHHKTLAAILLCGGALSAQGATIDRFEHRHH